MVAPPGRLNARFAPTKESAAYLWRIVLSKVAWMKRTGTLSRPSQEGGRSGTRQCPDCAAGGIQDGGWRGSLDFIRATAEREELKLWSPS